MGKKGKSKNKITKIEGTIRKTKRGFGFLENEEFGEDIFIRKSHMKDAMEGDTAEVELIPRALWKGGPEGFVSIVKERAVSKLVGTLDTNGKSGKNIKSGFLIPMGNRIKEDVYIPQKCLHGARHGDKVLVEIKKFPREGKLPEGEIIEIIARASDSDKDVMAVIFEHGLVREFPREIEDETRKVAKLVLENTKSEDRLDLRNEQIITIDGAYSKDLDDAVSLTINDAGNYVLGVHIADVSSFVREGMKLDEEALKRGNSVYLINHVIPMLPKLLSNDICSLNEGKDRLTVSCIMEIDGIGKVVDYKICESIINSKGRLVYDDVSDFLEEGIVSDKIEAHKEILKAMDQLAELLRKSREELGSIDFDIDEAEFEIDENGMPIDIFVAERRRANRLIEEFMLIANKTVAEHYFWIDYPFIYRVHEKPLPEKIVELKAFLKGIGIALPLNEGNLHPFALRKLLEEAKVQGKLSIVSTVMVRAMQKAFYTPECLGHYGLAFNQYTHFTSPIRRYSDLWIHRLIKYQLHQSINEKELSIYYRKAEEISKIVSATERKAISMEREIEKIKKAQFMEQWIGYEARGVISGITSFGFFVQLENTVEGLVRRDSLIDDYYDFDKQNYRMVGSAIGKVYSLGDTVDVVCIGVDPLAGTIDFELI